MEIAEFTRVVKEDGQAPLNRQLINSKTHHFSTEKRTALPNHSKPYQLKNSSTHKLDSPFYLVSENFRLRPKS